MSDLCPMCARRWVSDCDCPPRCGSSCSAACCEGFCQECHDDRLALDYRVTVSRKTRPKTTRVVDLIRQRRAKEAA